MKSPDRAALEAPARRVTDQMRGATRTILTSGRGATEEGTTQGKTLLGQ